MDKHYMKWSQQLVSNNVNFIETMKQRTRFVPDCGCITCLHMRRKPHTDIRESSIGGVVIAEDETQCEDEHEESTEAN